MKKTLLYIIICSVLFSINASSSFTLMDTTEEEVIPSRFELTSYSLQSVPSKDFSKYQYLALQRGFEEEDLAKLLSFTSVKTLDFYDATDIRSIKRLPVISSVRVLNLCGRPISSFDFPKICRYRDLEVLDLSSTGISGYGIEQFSVLESLKVLNLSRNPISKISYVNVLLERSPSLTVHLYGTYIKKTQNPRIVLRDYVHSSDADEF